MLIQKYVIRQWLTSLLLITIVLLAVVILVVPFFQFQKYTVLDEQFILKVLPYFIPISLVYILPLATLLSCIFVFGRLSEDNELLAIKSSGIPLLRVIRPILMLSFILALGIVLINNHLIPYCQSQTRQLTISAFKSRIFTGSQGADEIKLPLGKLYYGSSKDGVFESVRLLQYDGTREELTKEISAQRGTFRVDEENAVFSLDLTNVYLTEWRPDKPTPGNSIGPDSAESKAGFPRLLKAGGQVYQIDVSKLFEPSKKNIANMTNEELDDLLAQNQGNANKTRQILMNKYQRFASGLTPLIFAFIGIPIGIIIKKGSRIAGIGAGMLILFVGYYPLMMLGNLTASKAILPVALSVWLANIILGLLAFALIYYIIKNDK